MFWMDGMPKWILPCQLWLSIALRGRVLSDLAAVQQCKLFLFKYHVGMMYKHVVKMNDMVDTLYQESINIMDVFFSSVYNGYVI